MAYLFFVADDSFVSGKAISLPVRVRFAATRHRSGQAGAENPFFLSGKISDFYATNQIEKGCKTLVKRLFIRFVKSSAGFPWEESSENRMQNANDMTV